MSLSLDYIQASSGCSPEAWRPAEEAGEDADESKSQGPCFMYGQRIISRKMRRVQRPMSAVERVMSSLPDEDVIGSSEVASMTSSSLRPRSSPGKHIRPASASSWIRCRDSANEFAHNHNDFTLPLPSETRSITMADSDRLSTCSGGSSTRVTPREAWEDDTTLTTKKILKAQALAQSGKRSSSLYMSAGDVMTAQASRNVRNLRRKIRVTGNPSSFDSELGSSSSPRARSSSPRRPVSSAASVVADKPPKRPTGVGRNSLGRRATIGEIINQHKPTLSANAWRNHLGRTASNPMSISGQSQVLLEAKKHINDTHRAQVDEKVKSFVRGQS